MVCFSLNNMWEEVPPLPEIWLFFKIIFKQIRLLEKVILHKCYKDKINERLMMVSLKDHKHTLWVFMFVYLGGQLYKVSMKLEIKNK